MKKWFYQFVYGNDEEKITKEYSIEEKEIIENLSSPEHVVLNKIEKVEFYRKKYSFNRKIKYSKLLSSALELKNRFLFRKYQHFNSSTKSTSTNNNNEINYSFLNYNHNNSKKDTDKSDLFFIDEEKEDDFLILDWKKENEVENKNQIKKKLKISLVISEINENTFLERMKKKVISKIITTLPYGMFHTSLLFSGLKIEWNDSSIVIPRRLKSNAILVIDILEIQNETEYNKICNIICERISHWNSSIYFDSIKNNCQSFLNDILSSIGVIELKIPKIIKNFIKKIQTNCSSDLEIKFNNEFCTLFNFEKSNFIFKSHKELDQLLSIIFKKDKNLFFTHFKEYAFILKSFDRAFWLSYLRKPDEKNTPFDCVFQNPFSTNSFNSFPNIYKQKKK